MIMDRVRTESLKLDNKEAKKMMVKFWETYDYIWDNLDNMTFDEYKLKSKEMWGYRNKIMDISGDIFLLTLTGLDNAVAEKWGDIGYF